MFCERRRELGRSDIYSYEILHTWLYGDTHSILTRERRRKRATGRTAWPIPLRSVTFVRTRVDRPNFTRPGKTIVRGQFLERSVLHHPPAVISLSMVQTRFDYPRRRPRCAVQILRPVVWGGNGRTCGGLVRTASGFGDRLNASRESTHWFPISPISYPNLRLSI